MRTQRIEPGLLKVFRLYNTILWALLLLAACGALNDPAGLDPLASVLLVQTTFLAGYLAWPRLRRWLGRFYLPLALALVSLAPSVGYALQVLERLADGVTGQAAVDDPGSLLLLLIVPLLLWSSQYGARAMVLFVSGVALLDLSFGLVFAAANGPPLKTFTEPVLIRSLVFGVVGYVVARLSAAQREQRLALAQKNAQLTHYASTLEQLSTSRERNRMARELHDTLAHTLSAMTIQLGALEVLLDSDPAAGRALLAGVREMSREGLHELRRALHDLRASPLEDLGFALALRQMTETAAERAGLRLVCDLADPPPALRPEIEQHLYRITDEAVTNVIRHANATTLTVTLRRKRGRLGLLITDDGVGFDPSALNGGSPGAGTGYGLVGMRERALLCSAELRIDSAPQQGTTVQVWIEEQTA